MLLTKGQQSTLPTSTLTIARTYYTRLYTTQLVAAVGGVLVAAVVVGGGMLEVLAPALGGTSEVRRFS